MLVLYWYILSLIILNILLLSINIDPGEGFLKNGQSPLLTIYSAGHALHVFINGQLSGKHGSCKIMSSTTLIWLTHQLLILESGTVYGGLENPKLTFSDYIKLGAGINKISLLSVAVGLPVSFFTCIHFLYNINCRTIWCLWSLHCHIDMNQNVGLHFETWNAGVLGPVTLKGLNEGTRDLSRQKWSYKVCCLYDFCSSLQHTKKINVLVLF